MGFRVISRVKVKVERAGSLAAHEFTTFSQSAKHACKRKPIVGQNFK